MNAIAPKIGRFPLVLLHGICQASADTLYNIADAAGEGHPDALNAVLSSLSDMTDRSYQGVEQYYGYLNQEIRRYLSLNPNNRFLGLERAFCDLTDTQFSQLTTGVAPDMISRLKRSITWYKEFVEIFKRSQLGQLDGLSAAVQPQENSSSCLCEFISNKVLQRDMDETRRGSRISFVHSFCDYLATMGHYQIVLSISRICKTYQAGLKGDYSLAYADSVLEAFSAALLRPCGHSLFGAGPKMEPERDDRYNVAYRMLKTFNENLGLWIQFKRGRDVLLEQKTVVDRFKAFL